MTNITIGRYDTQTVAEPGGPEHPLSDVWAGWIEGTREDGTTWITYLGSDGSPVLHWPHREPSGAVIGDPITLS